MGKNHLKRLAMPKTWQVKKKKNKFITRPSPGAHSFYYGMPLNLVLKELIKCAKTTKEVKHILNNKTTNVDGKRRKSHKMLVGLMDVIELKEAGEFFRIILNEKGKIKAVKIRKEEAAIKPSKITGKTIIRKGVVQLNLIDGRNILVKKDEYSVGDTLVLALPGQEIKESIRLSKGVLVYLIGGKHIGASGVLKDISKDKIKFILKGGVFETSKKYAFAIGKDKPVVTISEAEK